MTHPDPDPAEFRESPHNTRWATQERPPSLRERVHLGFLTPRGWGLFSSGVVALGGSWVLGRRELMAISLFLIVIPLLASLLLRFGRSPISVTRTFNPAIAEAGSGIRVRLKITHEGRSPGLMKLNDTLPLDFGHGPEFSYPSRSAIIDRGVASSMYEYRLRLASRGVYPIGPVKAQVTDPFGLAMRPAALDTPSALVAMPPVESLELGAMPGERGNHGQASSNRRLTPDSFDVMTREYRDGDSVRRIHWPATASRGSIMVRQEEYRATPRAIIMLDRSRAAFLQHGVGSEIALEIPQFTAAPKQSSQRFEWALQAALGIGAYLSESGYGIEMVDHRARPVNQVSTSGTEDGSAVFSGAHAVEDMQCALAALGLEDVPTRPHEGQEVALSAGLRTKLRADGDRLVLLLGDVSVATADTWIESVGAQRKVMVIVVVHRPEQVQAVIQRFRQAGWAALATSPKMQLADAWDELGRQS